MWDRPWEPLKVSVRKRYLCVLTSDANSYRLAPEYSFTSQGRRVVPGHPRHQRTPSSEKKKNNLK